MYRYCIEVDDCENIFTVKLLHKNLFSEKEFKELLKKYALLDMKLLIEVQTTQEIKSGFWGDTYEEVYNNLYEFYKDIHILEETRTGRILREFLHTIVFFLERDEGFIQEIDKPSYDVHVTYSSIGKE